TLDQRIRVGQEPIKNLVWDVNTALNFKPNILTKVFDALPIVETSADSKLKIEAEYAQVNPDPNTFKEDGLGEKGVAYIDDFEGSKRTTSLGVQYRIWNYASIPQRFRILERDTVDYTILPTDEDLMLKMDKNRVKMNWFNPFNQVPIKEIWPNRDVNAQTGTTTNVLNMRWKNDSIPPDSAWAGVMRSTISFPDQKKTKFIEIWLKPRLEGELKNSKAQINIDIGRISEDWWVRGTNADGIKSLGNLNTEDINNNGLLDEGEDIGIHTSLPGTPGYDPGQKWAPPGDTNPAFLLINGTEGNGQQKSARYPDTEDMDADGNLNIFNDYFEYSFDLSDTTNPWIQGATQWEDGTFTGWRQYRIPIRNYDRDAVVGDPDTTFQDIFFVRVWINNIPMDGQFKGLQIATIDFVGSDWEEKGVSGGLRRKGDNDFVLDDSLFSVSVINDEENAVEGPNKEAYHSPPGVTGIEDRITRAVSKEQSLLLQLHRLDGDSTIAETEKRLGTKLNLVHYRTMKMFVHGDRKLPDTDSPLEFYIRFGSTEDIYYEYGEKVYPHWDSRNEIVLDFDALTQTRDEKFQPDTSKQVFYRRDPKNPEKYFLVKGKPGLHNINYFVFGVRNTGGAPLERYEVWVDELRVTDIEKETGVAMRLLTDLTSADVARVTATWEVVDDNFRLVEQQFPSKNGKDKTREKQSYTANVKLHKFLPN
ncbi:MAG: cell surface protein SprA, partial [Calditrichia bacterium]